MLTARSIVRVSAATSLLGAAIMFVACQRRSDGEAITETRDPSKVPSAEREKAPSPSPAKAQEKPAPERHRPAAVACSTDKVKGDVETRAADAGEGSLRDACKRDAECTGGKNGRCAMTGGGRLRPSAQCVYDACFSDADCGTKSECQCGGSPGVGNACVKGNCAIDGDCGDGYCSPSYGISCGPYGGYQGNYCHHRQVDECTNDSECAKAGQHGYCAWFSELGHWKCGYGYCVG